MKVAVYCRVSTKDQNIETQLSVCRRHCEIQGYEVFKEYIDEGYSGSKSSRPSFNKMLEDMRKYKFKGIIVYKIDRIGRSLQHLMNLFNEFSKRKIEFTSVTQNIDTTTPEGRMFMKMMMLLAEYERELTVDRVKEGMKRARTEGKRIGRPKTGIDGKEVLRLHLMGYSIRKIRKKLGCSVGTVHKALKKNNEVEQ